MNAQQILLQVIDFAISQGSEAATFLSAWREGDTSEWPEFIPVQDEQPVAVPRQNFYPGWRWMVHPRRNGGEPMPVLLTEDNGDRYYEPLEPKGESDQLDWMQREKGWRTVPWPNEKSGTTKESCQPKPSQAASSVQPIDEVLCVLAGIERCPDIPTPLNHVTEGRIELVDTTPIMSDKARDEFRLYARNALFNEEQCLIPEAADKLREWGFGLAKYGGLWRLQTVKGSIMLPSFRHGTGV